MTAFEAWPVGKLVIDLAEKVREDTPVIQLATSFAAQSFG